MQHILFLQAIFNMQYEEDIERQVENGIKIIFFCNASYTGNGKANFRNYKVKQDYVSQVGFGEVFGSGKSSD